MPPLSLSTIKIRLLKTLARPTTETWISWPKCSQPLGLPLELTAVEEGAAYGAALLGGVAAGVFADVHEAVAACVRIRERIDPNERWSEAYEAGYGRFRALYQALKTLEEA